MAQPSKRIARLTLQGISILGMSFGFSCFVGAIDTVTWSGSEHLTILCGLLVLSGALLVLGVYLIYSSYLMLRGRAFGAIKPISVFLAFLVLGLGVRSAKSLGAASVSGNLPRYVDVVCVLAAVVGFYVVLVVCIKLLTRLSEVAYGDSGDVGIKGD
jgi:cytochrome bd-type quinol oxidase subunit 2